MYIAATPLDGMERVDSLLEALGRSAQKLAALHTMTIIEEGVDGKADVKVSKPPIRIPQHCIEQQFLMRASIYLSNNSLMHLIQIMHCAAGIHSL